MQRDLNKQKLFCGGKHNAPLLLSKCMYIAGHAVDYSIGSIVIPWQVLQELDFLKDNKSHTFSDAKSNRARR